MTAHAGGAILAEMAQSYRLPDGTPVFHPIGELLIDVDDEKVCCGLCGRWFRALGGHLFRTHAWSADDYRVAFGLNAQRPLQAPAVSEAQANGVRRRLQTDTRLQSGMRKGLVLARSGRLNAAWPPGGPRARPSSGAPAADLRQGERMGRLRAARFRADRDLRARTLGFADSGEHDPAPLPRPRRDRRGGRRGARLRADHGHRRDGPARHRSAPATRPTCARPHALAASRLRVAPSAKAACMSSASTILRRICAHATTRNGGRETSSPRSSA